MMHERKGETHVRRRAFGERPSLSVVPAGRRAWIPQILNERKHSGLASLCAGPKVVLDGRMVEIQRDYISGRVSRGEPAVGAGVCSEVENLSCGDARLNGAEPLGRELVLVFLGGWCVVGVIRVTGPKRLRRLPREPSDRSCQAVDQAEHGSPRHASTR